MKPTLCMQCAYHARLKLRLVFSYFFCYLTIFTEDAMCRTSLTTSSSAAVGPHVHLARPVLKVAWVWSQHVSLLFRCIVPERATTSSSHDMPLTCGRLPAHVKLVGHTSRAWQIVPWTATNSVRSQQVNVISIVGLQGQGAAM